MNISGIGQRGREGDVPAVSTRRYKRIRKRRGLALTAILALLAVFSKHPASAEELKLEASWVLPVAELSGLLLLGDESPGVQGLAAGDSGFFVVRFAEGTAGGPWKLSSIDLAGRVDASPGSASQWEALARDRAGNICFLAELGSQIHCLDKKLGKRIGNFILDPSPLRDLDKAWKIDPNSRGEGLILLKQGHALLLKEKRPSLLVEFGPSGEPARGFGPESLLAPGEAFALPLQGKLVALKAWSFSASLAALAHDGSDLAVGPDGRLYLLSDESRTLARLEGRLKPDESAVRETASWKLPRELQKPEGLAIDKDMQPWIVVDQKRTGRPALFRLSRIPAS